MKKLALISLITLVYSCQKSKNIVTSSANQTTTTNSTSKDIIAAKINDRPWKSAAKPTSSTSGYLAAIKNGSLQIKTYGSFADSTGVISEDQLGIYIEGVTDTGTYTLSLSNYIAYNQLSEIPQYYSSQLSNIGFVRITNLTDTTISGTFECRVDNTSGSGLVSIKEGTFSNVVFQ